MRRLARVLLPLSVLTAAGLPVAASAAAAPAATTVVNVRPVDAAGHLSSGYRIVRNLAKANCRFGSEATGTAYRCFAGNFVVDPCWVTNDTAYVDCLPEPWNRAVWRLHVTKGFDNSGYTRSSGRSSLPWGVEEVGGVKCGYAQGATGSVGKYRLNYFCQKTQKEALIGGVDRSTPLWTIRKARDTGNYHYVRDGRAQLEKAWYGRPSRKG